MIWNWRPWFALCWLWRPVCWWLCVRDMIRQARTVRRSMWVTPQGHRWRQYWDERDTRRLYVWVCDRCGRCMTKRRQAVPAPRSISFIDEAVPWDAVRAAAALSGSCIPAGVKEVIWTEPHADRWAQPFTVRHNGPVCSSRWRTLKAIAAISWRTRTWPRISVSWKGRRVV